MNLETFLNTVETDIESLEFNDLMGVIETNYNFTPTQFTNGELLNKAGQNDGSCKLFSFAKAYQLTEQQTLACFGTYYRDDVLKHPDEDNHQNIRNFMKTGWAGIQFDADALLIKPA
ncbi:MAG: HopJ type III effector protein [Cocleimonas sp.]